MKKIRFAVCVMMLALAMFCMTGCGNKDNSGQGSSSQTTTSSSKESGSTSGGTDQTGGNTEGSSSENGTAGSTGSSGANESGSGGVIEGLVDDVERGVDDLTGDDSSTTAAADESR